MKKSISFFIIFQVTAKMVFSQFVQYPEFTTISFEGITKKLSDAPDAGFTLRGMLKTKQQEDDEKERNQANVIPTKVNTTDNALQKTYTSSTEISVLSNWNGLKSKYLRSDNNLAVGPNHVVQMINSNSFSSLIRVWNKEGDLLIDRKYFFDLTGELDYGDPNIIYDQQADRFVISFLYSGMANKLILCASQTADPTGAWYYYIINTPYGFPDYEKLAVWGDSYIITTAAGKPAIYAINRAEVLAGTVSLPVLNFKPYRIPNIGWQGCSPVNQTGAFDVPADEPAIVARVIDDAWFAPSPSEDRLELFELHINWDDPESSFMSEPIELPIENYNSDLCGFNSNSCLDQKGSSIKLWPVSNFITDKAQYRNFDDYQSIVCSHVCNADGSGTAGVRWYELRKETGGSWYIHQQSTYQPTGDHRWISSVTINDAGSIALGYNISSNEIYPGMRITGRTVCDELNMMAEEVSAKEGTSHNFTLNYGDYNGIVTDPVDGTFWFTGQFNSSPHWSTNVVHFSIEACEEEKQNIQVENINVFSLSPVPANNNFNISYSGRYEEDVIILIFDINGQLVKKDYLFFSPLQTSYYIDCTSFPAGNYIVQCFTDKGTQHLDLIVQH
ncbi:MAG: T9SS type A sorting domain-containing protein [Chitinophagales bacterium]